MKIDSTFFKDNLFSERLSFKRLSHDYSNELMVNWGSDAEVFKTLSCNPVNTPEAINKMIKKSINSFNNNLFFRFVIFFENSIVGMVTLTPRYKVKHCEIGLSLASSAWNKGVGTETVNFFHSLFKGNDSFTKLFCTVREENKSSLKLFKKAGFKVGFKGARKVIYGEQCYNPYSTCIYLDKYLL